MDAASGGAPAAWKYYWEDFTPGETREFGSVTPTREETLAFARQFDPQPFHLDDAAAEASMFKRLSASGWHTCAMAMRLMVDGFLNESASLGSPGMDNIKWMKPVYPGDTLTLRTTIVESRPMKSRPDVGIVRSLIAMVNQDGEQVLHMEGFGMYRRRHPG
ncbi:MAG: MaoC family dehydratase [Pseudomonadota bacterium]